MKGKAPYWLRTGFQTELKIKPKPNVLIDSQDWDKSIRKRLIRSKGMAAAKTKVIALKTASPLFLLLSFTYFTTMEPIDFRTLSANASGNGE